MIEQMNILFVCTVNRMRSITAEKMYETDERFTVKSAGTDPCATVKITAELLVWADFIIVMERVHRNKIRKLYPDIYNQKRILCLYILDEYDFMQPQLIDLIKNKFEHLYRTEIASNITEE